VTVEHPEREAGLPMGAGSDRLLAIGVGATIALAAAGAAAQFIGYGAYGMGIRWLDSSADGGLFGAIGDAALATAAIASCVMLARTHRRSVATIALPPLLIFLAVDKVVRLHDEVPHWPVLYLPLLGAAGAALLGVATRLPVRERRLVRLGVALLTASFLVHLVGEPLVRELGASPGGLPYQLKAVGKHSAELAGWLLCAVGMAVGVNRWRAAGAIGDQKSHSSAAEWRQTRLEGR
jgi:hypothetical protein